MKIREKNKAFLGDADSRFGYFRNMNKINLFFTMIYAKTIFRTWKNWVERRKERISNSMSITPPFSDLEFPGLNSLNSSYESLGFNRY